MDKKRCCFTSFHASVQFTGELSLLDIMSIFRKVALSSEKKRTLTGGEKLVFSMGLCGNICFPLRRIPRVMSWTKMRAIEINFTGVLHVNPSNLVH